MNTLTLKIAASLFALFGLGAATGALAIRQLAPHADPPAARAGRGTLVQRPLRGMPHPPATHAPADDGHRGRFSGSVRDLNESIARDLTPEQRKQLWSHMQERWQRRDTVPQRQ
jgi:hypothetical protein